jgi:hypothetical protein
MSYGYRLAVAWFHVWGSMTEAVSHSMVQWRHFPAHNNRHHRGILKYFKVQGVYCYQYVILLGLLLLVLLILG